MTNRRASLPEAWTDNSHLFDCPYYCKGPHSPQLENSEHAVIEGSKLMWHYCLRCLLELTTLELLGRGLWQIVWLYIVTPVSLLRAAWRMHTYWL